MGSHFHQGRERPSRRRSDDDYAALPEHDFVPRSPFSAPRPATSRPAQTVTPTGPETKAAVKWFNTEKGFGFVEIPGAGDVFFHISALGAFSQQDLLCGTTLTVRIGHGQKGLQVAEVLALDASTGRPQARPQRHSSAETPAHLPRTEISGTVKWFNTEKGFGFITPSDGTRDIFLHVSAIDRSGVQTLREGHKVIAQVVQGQKGLQVDRLELLED